MARWTNMTWTEFVVRYRAGAAAGRSTWPDYLLRVASVGEFITLLNTWRLVTRHALDQAAANAHLHTALLFLIGLLFTLAWIVWRDQVRRESVMPALLLGGISAALVLFLCSGF